MTKALRRSLTALVMTMALLGLTVACSTEPISDAEIDVLRVGISYGDTLPSMNDQQLADALDTAVEIGAGWIRADLSWVDIQPTDAKEFLWSRFDRIVAAATRRGLEVLPILAYTPPWAREPGCASEHCPPADPASFASFAAAAAARYGQKGVHSWEIWNEPNSASFWQPKADSASYARLLGASGAAIRGADHDALIILGGLATLRTADGNESVSDFLLGSQPSPLSSVDALAIHPYTYPLPPSMIGPWASPWDRSDSGLPYVRQILSAAGKANMPIWITEYGAPTGGPGPVWDGSPASLSKGPDHVTESQQADIATDAIATAASDPAIAGVFWYTYRDFGPAPESTERHYGIRRADGSEKPVLAALTAAIRNAAR